MIVGRSPDLPVTSYVDETSRQSVYSWLKRFEAEGEQG
ncbi:helix-turn-helix domain-containing protein [Amycolatopsis sp. NPDC059021]